MTIKTLDLLTPRERVMLKLLADGKSSSEIADKIDLTAGSVRVYLHDLYRKLGLRNRTQAAVWAIRNGVTK